MEMTPEFAERLKRVKLLLLDVDGVLTNGDIIYGDNGAETKVFSVKDGLGLRLLQDAGVKAGIVTGRSSDALFHRCRDLDIDLVFDGIHDKSAALDIIIVKTGIPSEAIAFVGDDLPDLPLMKRVGLSVAVADAHEECLNFADLVTQRPGGAGAVREVCDMILKANALWDEIMERF